MLATTQGKQFALDALKRRRKESITAKQRDNSSLPAGSPMYFYCKACSALADVLPESYLSTPKVLCDECQALKDLGWLE